MEMKLFWTLLLTAGLVAPAVAQEENTDDAPKTSEPAAKAEESPPADPPPTEPAPAATESPDSEKPASEDPPPAQPDLTSEKGKTSYAIGASIGRGLKNDGADIDPELVGRGLIDAFVEGEVQLTNEEIRAAIIAFKDKLRRDAQARYLDNNKTRLGVKTTESGLQYRVIAAGDGATPKQTDTVKVHYRGTLIDGTEFDSSYDSGEPSTFPVAGVIAGWTEALKLMKVGSHWEVVVPADLGYGENPRPGGKIKPGDALIFDMKLLGIAGQQTKPDETKPDAAKPKDDADKPDDKPD
ncbi:MAG: FKBP-type peptidyl-prolyl cis-trans isomerase, partial [Planctomycetota bacterium]|nr:FKBP-type peptidyl-prolyl cis-trans isomerase [Planctomycetota bacterium]